MHILTPKGQRADIDEYTEGWGSADQRLWQLYFIVDIMVRMALVPGVIMAYRVIKQAKDRLAREEGTVIKDWGGRLPVALVYPNTYYVGMSNLGVHAVYRLLNSYGRVVGERV